MFCSPERQAPRSTSGLAAWTRILPPAPSRWGIRDRTRISTRPFPARPPGRPVYAHRSGQSCTHQGCQHHHSESEHSGFGSYEFHNFPPGRRLRRHFIYGCQVGYMRTQESRKSIGRHRQRNAEARIELGDRVFSRAAATSPVVHQGDGGSRHGARAGNPAWWQHPPTRPVRGRTASTTTRWSGTGLLDYGQRRGSAVPKHASRPFNRTGQCAGNEVSRMLSYATALYDHRVISV